MLEIYKYFVRGNLTVGFSCVGKSLYVARILDDHYKVSLEYYEFLSKAGDTKLVRALLC
jgi:hypothetical protein